MYVNAAISDDLLVLNEVPRFLRFDWQAFLADNFYSSPLRDSFPGALSLSLLTGEFTFEYLGFPGQCIMRATFLPILVLLAIGVVCKPKSLNDWPGLPTLLLFGSHALFMVAYNWRYPFACNQDARLWAPVFFPAAVLVAGGFEAVWRKVSGGAGRIVLGMPLPFPVQGVIQLWGKGMGEAMSSRFPKEVLNLPIRKRCTNVHLLHGAGFYDADGTPVAKLVLHYVDQTRHEIDLKAGEHLRDWWGSPSQPMRDPGTLVAWYGQNPYVRKMGPVSQHSIRVYCTYLK